jgi:hypothetical protein
MIMSGSANGTQTTTVLTLRFRVGFYVQHRAVRQLTALQVLDHLRLLANPSNYSKNLKTGPASCAARYSHTH